ncbi:MAG: phosphoglycerate kinase [Patescibacteria group bacterium]|nr:phosphoglycerate kinase [Patescibacteria group bacterium]
MKVRSIASVKNLFGKRVLLRVDFNVPMKNGRVKEKYKIEKSLPTIKYLLHHDAKVILVSHLGRPKGADKKLSLKPVEKVLAKILGKKVGLVELKNAAQKIAKMADGSVILLENIRFIKGEDKNDAKLAKSLAELADIFVLDGFAVAHRDVASVSGVAKHLPSYAGLLLAEEVKGLNQVLLKPKKPFVVILGGAKMETKIPLIKKLLPQATNILVGGGIVNTCLWAKGYKVGRSIIEKEHKKTALAFLKNKKIIMPVDVVVGSADGQGVRVVPVDAKFKVKDAKFGIYDIGPKTISLFAKYIKKANTLVWNGAMGMFEQHPYQFGSRSVARLMATRAKGRAYGVTGGGETVELVKKLKLLDEIDLVSTGGGAMLEFLSGQRLPGVQAVSK